MAYSVVIKNGTIIDGAGSEPLRADIAVQYDKIEKIGNLQNVSADLTIDASNLYVAPGFIDLTTHSDTFWTLFYQPGQESFIKQGVTTILGGHGGVSMAPIIKTNAMLPLGRLLDTTDININWQTLEEFFTKLEKYPLGVNFATLIGHGTLRNNILKDENEKPNDDQIATMQNLLGQLLKAGAFGISTNFGLPSTQTVTEKEITLLLETIAKHHAISMHHLEDEGKNLLPAISKFISFLRMSGAKGHISHFKVLGHGSWDNFKNATNMLELAQKENINLTCDFFPYTSTGSSLTSLLPSWIVKENPSTILSLLKENEPRQNLITHLKSLTLHYDKIIISSTGSSDNISVGKTINQISQNSGLSGEEVILNLLASNDLRVSMFNEIISQEHIEEISQKPYSMVASDGVGYENTKNNDKKDLPHPRSFGTFSRILSSLVREKNILTWQEAIYKMSGLPASTLGISDRGVIKENNYADIVIFDPATVKDTADYKNPFQYPIGIQYVLVNGRLTMTEGNLTSNRTGRVLKRK